ncbi:MAG: class I SAM-dependent RNA methyltransferase [Melioribacteraceae bacterium]|jgi:putative N6-adenine-specific DNA methylase|nr:class I SAM-dependent RNA methyltransferase [Melioribacteraceae bacterium]
MYNYQKTNEYFAQVPGQMEELCEAELIELGAKKTKVAYRGIFFSADKSVLYKINYMSRLTSRVLAPVISFYCKDTKVLRNKAFEIKWDTFFPIDKTFSITASVSNSKIKNSLAASQYMKDGIVDYFRSVSDGKRPDVNVENPDIRFNLHIEDDEATISIDTSGQSLHKRGYRLIAGDAPMQETLAAALIRESKWNGEKPLWDCMCGSGTILAEALMHYCRIPAQILRTNFGFFYLPDYSEDTWNKVKDECDNKMRPLPKGLISGSDMSDVVLETARENLSHLLYSEAIELSCKKFQDVEHFENGLLVTNPPYGIRIGTNAEVKILYKELGDFLKQKCKGTTAFIYTGDPSLRKSIGLKTTRRIPLVNGKLEGILMQIDSYDGSKKRYYQEFNKKN